MYLNFSQEHQQSPSGREADRVAQGLGSIQQSHGVMFFSIVTQELLFCILFLAGFTGSRSYYFYTKIWQTEMTSAPIILTRLPERYWKENPWKVYIVAKLCTLSIILGLKRSSKRIPTEKGVCARVFIVFGYSHKSGSPKCLFQGRMA